MPSVHIERALNVPAIPAQAAASSILHDIAERRGVWQEFSLYLQLGALGVPDVGYIAIPVDVELGEQATQPQPRIAFTLHARSSPDRFPVLEGTLGIEPAGPSTSTLRVDGTYDLPGGAVGAAFNKLVGERAADKTLENMAADLADAIEARVQQRELSMARYRVAFNAGD